METLGSRRFVEIPGDRRHDLPPLLLHTAPEPARYEHAMELAAALIDEEELIPHANLPVIDPNMELLFDRRRTDLALQLVEHYVQLIDAWRLGDSILEWIRQCETTFELRRELRPLLRPDVWPHAGRSSFVTLLRDKSVPTRGVQPETAVGLRISFRQPPPLNCCTNQFLLLLKSHVASSAYSSWASLTPEPAADLPPERFNFEVHEM